MAMNYTILADEIADAIGHSGDVTTQVLGFARGIVEEITMNGAATFGTIPSPHSISGMSGPSMASKISTYAGYGYVTTELDNYCTAIVNYIQATAIVTYTGPASPPPGWYLGGTISGMTDIGLATEIKNTVGYPNVSSILLAKCAAIVNHIMINGSVISGVIS